MMLFIIGAISIASLFLNIVVLRKLAQYETVEILIEEVREEEPVTVESDTKTDPLITVPMVEEVYQPWRNRTGLSLSDYGPPQAPIKPHQVDPLERPGGFV